MFWLRELADMRPSEARSDWGCIKRLVFSCQGYNKCAQVYLTFFFMVMVACFMTLGCTYYIHVKGDPSLGGAFEEITTDGTVEAYLWPIIITMLLLVFYYTQFIIAATMGCVRLRDKENPSARKVSYCAGQIIHFFFIFLSMGSQTDSLLCLKAAST